MSLLFEATKFVAGLRLRHKTQAWEPEAELRRGSLQSGGLLKDSSCRITPGTHRSVPSMQRFRSSVFSNPLDISIIFIPQETED